MTAGFIGHHPGIVRLEDSRASAPAAAKKQPAARALGARAADGVASSKRCGSVDERYRTHRDRFVFGVHRDLVPAISWRYPNEKLLWDGENLRFTNNENANEFVRPNFRKGWELKEVTA